MVSVLQKGRGDNALTINADHSVGAGHQQAAIDSDFCHLGNPQRELHLIDPQFHVECRQEQIYVAPP